MSVYIFKKERKEWVDMVCCMLTERNFVDTKEIPIGPSRLLECGFKINNLNLKSDSIDFFVILK